MRRRIAGAIVAIALLGTTPATAQPTAHTTKTCSTGFRHAVIGGAEKCLRRGQRCSTSRARQYPRYGYRCINGRLR